LCVARLYVVTSFCGFPEAVVPQEENTVLDFVVGWGLAIVRVAIDIYRLVVTRGAPRRPHDNWPEGDS
jgi:hypothetical protein